MEVSSKPSLTDIDVQRGKHLSRSLKDNHEGPELFDDAESNMNPNFNSSDLDFPDKLEHIKGPLEELRRNTNPKELIPDHLMMSALNIYIENAMLIAKKNNMIDVSSWDDLSEDDDFSFAKRDRELLETSLSALNHVKNRKQRSNYSQSSFSNLEDPAMKHERDKGLLDLAERGELFDINLDNIYKSVGSTQVANFEKLYGVKRSH